MTENEEKGSDDLDEYEVYDDAMTSALKACDEAMEAYNEVTAPARKASTMRP